MFKFAIRIFLGLILTNWIYSEINLFVPQFIPTMQRVLNVVRIPTHDEWPAIARGAGVPEIDQSIKVAASSIARTENNLLARFFGRDVEGLWMRHTGKQLSLDPRALEHKATEIIRFGINEYLSGEDIFVSAGDSLRHSYIPNITWIAWH